MILSPGEHPESKPEISVVVPLFNEQENFPELYRRLSLSLTSLKVGFQLVFVNDGSTDATSALLQSKGATDPRVLGIHLSRNFGHQAAICAGIDHAQGQAVILMDGDLQDPPEILDQFIQRWRQGYEVVYAIRTRRKEGLIKKLGYYLFYRLLRFTSDLNIPLDSGDFCLMDRKVVEVLKHLPEKMRFIRGLRTFVGFRQVGITYPRAARKAGSPKFSFRALVELAIDGLIGFSSLPLNLVTYLGFFTAALAIPLAVWVFADALYNQRTPRGWASIIAVILFTSTVQLISLGIIGEYIRRIFIETKGRPTYILRNPPEEEAWLKSSIILERPLPSWPDRVNNELRERQNHA